MALAATLALSACDAGRTAGPYAPATLPYGEGSVDGLIVGHRLMAAGEYELALKSYLRSAADQGITVDVLSALGSANLKLGRLGQAETLLRQATRKDPEFVPAWNNLGVVLMETGQVAEAARVFRIAYGLDSGKTDSIKENLTLALAKVENIAYGEDDTATFALMRRGQGDYLLLTNQ
ncbi:tetratricopeptide repeat protein [Maritimibacter fusiformis]|uniref:Tetratricopeptide repeat protein n=1 Tax=Maritimibacter fusiformis TaxID=2603819 RepID=A0A5D0RN03_9RHOB|nr:tetratricopeptide repeat protein [Maritimibacter fusiformis]TYB82977.1 tetratricopeptide repeat protein [Maritimibacter fusiformis]